MNEGTKEGRDEHLRPRERKQAFECWRAADEIDSVWLQLTASNQVSGCLVRCGAGGASQGAGAQLTFLSWWKQVPVFQLQAVGGYYI